MEDRIELTLQSIHGIAWRPSRASDGNDDGVSGIKACVSFSGSVSNMKVSSLAMCPESGSLVIESNTPELIEDSVTKPETNPQNTHLLNTTFTDPFEEKRLSQGLSSSNSTSSDASSFSYRPHLQFQLRKYHGADGCDDQVEESDADTRPVPDPRHDRHIKLHITFRSVDDGVLDIYSEGESDLILSDDTFEGLPLILDLPIQQILKNNSKNVSPDVGTKQSHIFFEDSAYIRVHLKNVAKRNHDISTKSNASHEFVLSDHVDEIQLGGMVKKIHERDYAAKRNLFGAGKGATKRHPWAFSCGEPADIKQSLQALFYGIRELRTKCVDPERELFTNITMTSTIDTRDSLKI